MIDLERYLTRIGAPGTHPPTRATLDRLHQAHLAAIPFENIDVRLGRPIRLDLESLQAKMVSRRRGGYCFEQNTLFAAGLRALGFEVSTLEARVRPPGAAHTLPRTHMTLVVQVDSVPVLADVGFGGAGPLHSVSLDGDVSEQPGGDYLVTAESRELRVLRHRWRGEWRDLYAFSLTPGLPVDFEVANHYTSTHPTSPFVNTLTTQRSEATGRHVLRGRTYTFREGDDENTHQVHDDELPDLLRERFALDVTEEEARLALGNAS